MIARSRGSSTFRPSLRRVLRESSSSTPATTSSGFGASSAMSAPTSRRSSVGRAARRATRRGPVSRGVIDSTSCAIDAERRRQRLGVGRLAFALELAARAPEAEEDLALRARRADAHRPVRAHHVLEHAGANPVGRVGRQPRRRDGSKRRAAIVRPEVALLDQVLHRGPGVAELHGDADDQPEVRLDQPRQRRLVLERAPATRQPMLLDDA